MLRERLGCQLIEPAFRDIAIELPIPRLPVILGEPVAERRQFFASQLLNFAFESLDFRHDR